MEVEVVGGLQGTATVCAQPGLHYRSKSTGGGSTGVTDLTFVWALGVVVLLLHWGKIKGKREKPAAMTSTEYFSVMGFKNMY